jgi:hypothetical protein
MNGLVGLGYFLIFLHIFFMVITIVIACKKGYNGFLAFLLCLCIPLFGALIIIGLLPDNNIRHSSYRSSASGNSAEVNLGNVASIRRIDETKRCKKCGKSVDSNLTSCPHCGGSEFN